MVEQGFQQSPERTHKRIGKFGEKITESIPVIDVTRVFADATRVIEGMKLSPEYESKYDLIKFDLGNAVFLKAWVPKPLGERHYNKRGYYFSLYQEGEGEGFGDDFVQVEYDDRAGDIKFAEFQTRRPVSGIDNTAVDQELLRVKSFDENGLNWEQVDREYDVVTEFGLHEEHINNQGRSSYGEEISVKGNKYVVDREGNKVTVKCLSGRNKPIWTSSFQLDVDMNSIREIYADPNSDFRLLKPLLSASLIIH